MVWENCLYGLETTGTK